MIAEYALNTRPHTSPEKPSQHNPDIDSAPVVALHSGEYRTVLEFQGTKSAISPSIFRFVTSSVVHRIECLFRRRVSRSRPVPRLTVPEYAIKYVVVPESR